MLQSSGGCRIESDHHVSSSLYHSRVKTDGIDCLSVQKCDEIIVLHLGYLNYTQYQAVVSFKGLENITYDIKVNFMVGDKH